MSTITKEQLNKIIFFAGEVTCHPDPNYWLEFEKLATPEAVLELARIALASLEAEPVGEIYQPKNIGKPATFSRETNDQIAAVMLRHGTVEQQAEALRYAGASQAGHISVPDESAVELLATDLMKRIDKITGERHSVATLSTLRVSIVEACRAAMLQGAKS